MHLARTSTSGNSKAHTIDQLAGHMQPSCRTKAEGHLVTKHQVMHVACTVQVMAYPADMIHPATLSPLSCKQPLHSSS